MTLIIKPATGNLVYDLTRLFGPEQIREGAH